MALIHHMILKSNHSMQSGMGDLQTWCKLFWLIISSVLTISLSCINNNLGIPYSAYISWVFNFANFANLESFAKLFQRKIDTSKLSHIGDVKDGAWHIEQRLCEIISTKLKKTAIRENLDP